MEKITKIIIGSAVGVTVLGGIFYIVKKKINANSASNGTLGKDGVPPPTVKDDSAALKNNYVLWTYEIMKTINETYDPSVGALLANQLNLAWNNSPAGIPSYNNDVALAIYGTIDSPNGRLFAFPSSIGTALGKDSMLQTVYGNALILLTVAGKNICQKKYSGQLIGKSQTILRGLYIKTQHDVFDINAVPSSAANMLAGYGYVINKSAPAFYSANSAARPSDIASIQDSTTKNNNEILTVVK